MSIIRQVTAIKTNSKEIDNHIERLLSVIPQSHRKRFLELSSKEERYRSLTGEVIIRSMICQLTGLKNEVLNFNYSEQGKPFIDGLPNLHFNLSHSQDWVVAILDEEPIGIDVEFIQSINLKVAKRFFSKFEYESLMNLEGTKRLQMFYRIWTLKESFIKAIGKGFSIPLSSFSTITRGNELTTLRYEDKNYYLKEFHIEPAYKLSVCYSHQEPANDIRILHLEQLVNDKGLC